jgi:Chlorophyll A-B binding protein
MALSNSIDTVLCICIHLFFTFPQLIADFGWHQFKPSDPEKYKAKVDSELLNGRLAMIAVGGIATQSIITGHGFPYV